MSEIFTGTQFCIELASSWNIYTPHKKKTQKKCASHRISDSTLQTAIILPVSFNNVWYTDFSMMVINMPKVVSICNKYYPLSEAPPTHKNKVPMVNILLSTPILSYLWKQIWHRSNGMNKTVTILILKNTRGERERPVWKEERLPWLHVLCGGMFHLSFQSLLQ